MSGVLAAPVLSTMNLVPVLPTSINIESPCRCARPCQRASRQQASRRAALGSEVVSELGSEVAASGLHSEIGE